MKKLFYAIFPLFVCLLMVGCDTSGIRLAFFSNATSPGSENYTMRVTFQNDKRYEEKYFDIQLMSTVSDVELTFWQEGEDKLSATIGESGVWNSLTSLKLTAAGLEGRENFDQLKEAVSQTYIFNVSKECKLIFRVVAGEIAENTDKTGFILALAEPISDDFVLNCA